MESSNKLKIVAECGVNHGGDLALAHRYIDEAADSGADAIKFQTFNTENYVSKSDTKRFEMLKSFELNGHQLKKLKNYALKMVLEHIESLSLIDSTMKIQLKASIFTLQMKKAKKKLYKSQIMIHQTDL